MKKVELLAPAGDMEKLKTALHFGADAVYFAGKKFGLRAFSKNFENLAEPINYCHEHSAKAYVTVNAYMRDSDYVSLADYLKELEALGADGIIVADLGVMELAGRVAPNLDVHVSTQANITNLQTAMAYARLAKAKRVVLARELSLAEVENISKGLAKIGVETEVFVHGAMCISYSGRCLLSNYMTGRDSNRGECVQACRFSYCLTENSAGKANENREKLSYPIGEDERGTYILNSKDLCLVNHLQEILDAGVSSLKIEGRMKSPYYVGSVVNVYRRALDEILLGKKDTRIGKENRVKELEKTSHREFTTGFMFADGKIRQNYRSSYQTQDASFIALVLDNKNGELKLEMRNRFKVGDKLEILSSSDAHNEVVTVEKITDENGNEVLDAKNVQQKLFVKFKAPKSALNLVTEGDILRSVSEA